MGDGQLQREKCYGKEGKKGVFMKVRRKEAGRTLLKLLPL